MNPHVEQLFQLLTSLPDAQQEEIAESLLAEVRWELSLSSSASRDFLENMFESTKRDLEEGRTSSLDEFLARAEGNTN